MRVGPLILAMLAMTGPAAAETIQVYAAGSLRAVLTDIAAAYETATGDLPVC
jgi:molybdate transport system substrate-binding protein